MTREEAIEVLRANYPDACYSLLREAVEMAIKALGQEPILDKIRDEIEQTAKDYDKYDDYRRVRGLWTALEIIDKYKAGSKPKTGHWIKGECSCPVCGEDKYKDLDADVWSDWQPKFCPNCGAKMEESEDTE